MRIIVGLTISSSIFEILPDQECGFEDIRYIRYLICKSGDIYYICEAYPLLTKRVLNVGLD